jgi:outer membrane biosynthesis protein TonB
MENPPANATKDPEGARLARAPTRLKSWTLLLVVELGRVDSFRLTVPWIAALTVCVAVVLAFVAFAMVSYYNLRTENKALKKNLDEVRAALTAADKDKERALVRLMVLEGKAQPQKKEKRHQKKDKPASHKKPSLLASKAKQPPAPAPQSTDTKEAPSQVAPRQVKENKPPPDEKPTSQTSQVPTLPQPPASAAAKAQGAAVEEAKTVAEATLTHSDESHEATGTVSSDSLLVANFQVWPKAEDYSVRFQFDLKNMDPMGRKVNGYAFVVFKPEEGSDEPLRACPWTPLEDGKPTIYKRGQYFSIARFKLVRGRMPQIQDVGRFKTATVYVYSETGSLLLEKVHEVEDIVRS